MYVYWDILIRPILTLLRPRDIVEIGSESGKTTRYLLEFCRRHEAVLHVIEPSPDYDVTSWEAQYGDRFRCYQRLSREALPDIPRHDAVLIDGDHNWYTVFEELRLIERRSIETSAPYPLVMAHDVGWPYGRRDLYYDPENIPAAYRQPYARKGIRPGRRALEEQGGLNAHLCHATTERTPRNGVLTAVEDFLRETTLELELLIIPGFHGLALLFPAELRETHPRLARFLAGWELPPAVRRYVELLEAARIRARLAPTR